jgi:PEP-CTERM motif
LATGGPFGIDPTSFFGEFDAEGTPIGVNDISGSVTGTPSTTPVPEPSSLLLLGSGFLALGGFARKRLVALFN